MLIDWTITFFHRFVNNFSALLFCKINSLEIFNTVDFFQIFVALRNTYLDYDQFKLLVRNVHAIHFLFR